MYAELYQYLISYKQVALPGIGTFSLERKPAESDFANKRINSPVYSVNLHFPANTPRPVGVVGLVIVELQSYSVAESDGKRNRRG
jgi:hypothetical protein